jgi:NAD(P)-dependent dehydrogenase (short-subunit alcohol dehydrogenase family)
MRHPISRGVAIEAPPDIRVNCVAPGAVGTEG